MKLDDLRHDFETQVIGAADANVVSLHWLPRSDETEEVSLSQGPLILHPLGEWQGNVTLKLPTSNRTSEETER